MPRRERARLRAIEDRTPTEVEASRSADVALHDSAAAAERVLDLWVAQPLGLDGARDEALQAGKEIIAGQASLMADEAVELARSYRASCTGRSRSPRSSPVSVPASTLWLAIRHGRRSTSRSSRSTRGIALASDAAIPEEERRRAVAELIEQRPELPERFAALQNEVRQDARLPGPSKADTSPALAMRISASSSASVTASCCALVDASASSCPVACSPLWVRLPSAHGSSIRPSQRASTSC